MKQKSPLLIITALLGVSVAASFAGDPSAKTKVEKTIAKQAAAKVKEQPKEAIPGADVQPAAYFYTGKPYDEDLGGYVFNYRTYTPSTNRWITTDPSGFPDGANNTSYAGNCPTFLLDSFGLYAGTTYSRWRYGAGSSIVDTHAWSLGKTGVGLFKGIGPLGRSAMNHADGLTPGNWTLSESEGGHLKTESLDHAKVRVDNSKYDGYSLNDYVVALLRSDFTSSSAASGQYSINSTNFHYDKDTDGYFGFGDARLSLSGNYSISTGSIFFNATVSLSDYFDFSDYQDPAGNLFSATGTGYRLQDNGWIKPFQTDGSFTRVFMTDLE